MTGDCPKTKACSALAKILQISVARYKNMCVKENIIFSRSLSFPSLYLPGYPLSHSKIYQPVKQTVSVTKIWSLLVTIVPLKKVWVDKS